MWWSPCEVVLVGPNCQLGQKVTGEAAPAAAPRWRHDPATNTGIMTLFRRPDERCGGVMVTRRADIQPEHSWRPSAEGARSVA